MNNKICPRCNVLIPGNQVMHWSCFVERAWLLFLAVGVILFVLAVFFIVFIMRLPQFATSQREIVTSPVAYIPIAVISEVPSPIFTPQVLATTALSSNLLASTSPTPSPAWSATLSVEFGLTPSATVEATPISQFVGTVKTNTLNLRQGPSTNYPSIDKLSLGTNIIILGRNTSGTWLLVSVLDKSQQGWVSADFIQSTFAFDSIPLAAAPPLPPTITPLPQTPSPTPSPIPVSTSTLVPPAGVVLNFYADQNRISHGSCTDLHWGIENVKELYLDGRGVRGFDKTKICPGTTTTYTMRIVLKDGSSIERHVVVQVE